MCFSCFLAYFSRIYYDTKNIYLFYVFKVLDIYYREMRTCFSFSTLMFMKFIVNDLILYSKEMCSSRFLAYFPRIYDTKNVYLFYVFKVLDIYYGEIRTCFSFSNLMFMKFIVNDLTLCFSCSSFFPAELDDEKNMFSKQSELIH